MCGGRVHPSHLGLARTAFALSCGGGTPLGRTMSLGWLLIIGALVILAGAAAALGVQTFLRREHAQRDQLARIAQARQRASLPRPARPAPEPCPSAARAAEEAPARRALDEHRRLVNALRASTAAGKSRPLTTPHAFTWDITYVDRDGVVTARTISFSTVQYRQRRVDAFCHLRQSERTFYFDRMLQVRVHHGPIVHDIDDWLRCYRRWRRNAGPKP